MSTVDVTAPVAVGAAPRFRRSRLVTDPLLAGVWLFFAVAHLQASWQTHRPVGLGTTALELIFACLFLCRRTPWVTSRQPLVWIVSAGGAFGMLAARPHYAPVLGLAPLYVVIQVVGALFAASSLVSLGRSFGVVAANRGVRTGGAYSLVRHPIYAGYAFADVGYVLENPSARNLLLAVTVLVFQIMRIRAEERVLDEDPVYRAYRARVRHRLFPGIW